jgi:hypothetical protein
MQIRSIYYRLVKGGFPNTLQNYEWLVALVSKGRV